MTQNSAIEPKSFISPITGKAELKMPIEIEYEYHVSDKLKGYLIDLMDENGEVSEVFFFESTESDVEDWIFENGEEDTDFYYDKEWDDSEGERGGYVNKKVLIEDSYDSNLREYILTHRNEWKQHE